jgi:RNA polymerase sigma factor (sigma-70 family)
VAGQLTVPVAESMEREYVAHRASVMAVLRADFGGLPDHEELYQEAWAEALEIQARGEEIQNLGALLRTIAWRRGRDRLRKQTPDTFDPTGPALERHADPGMAPEDVVAVRLDAALIRQVVESLEPRHAAVIKLRFERHLNSREIGVELGVSPKRLEKIVTEAYARVEQALAEPQHGESEWRRHQRSLLLACEAGLASVGQRQQARAMLRDDPGARALLAEIRRTLDRVAAILPVPLLATAAHTRLLRLRVGVSDRLAALRDALAGLAHRLTGHPLAAEQAGAGGTISLGGAAVLKATLVCVAFTGGTVVCLTGGLGHGHHPPTSPRPGLSARSTRAAEPIPRPALPAPARRVHVASRRVGGTTTRASAPAAPSPAPAGGTEFGPGAVGSSSAPAQASAAPSGGGGEFLP